MADADGTMEVNILFWGFYFVFTLTHLITEDGDETVNQSHPTYYPYKNVHVEWRLRSA